MARSPNPPILAQFRNARSLSEQTTALRALKNEIVGHIQKKEAWVALGVLEHIVATLESSRSTPKPNVKDAQIALPQLPLSEEETVRLQALQLIATFANGGPRFLTPLSNVGALDALLANLSPYSNPPQLVVATLRALTDIANASALAKPSSPLDTETLAESIFAAQHVKSFAVFLSISSSKPLLQSQLNLAAGLISRLCREERYQHILTTAGILDALSTRLASFAVARGHVVPGADSLAQADGLSGAFPSPAARTAQLVPILEAISAILGDSKYRAYRLINSPSILAVFPSIRYEPASGPSSSKQGIESEGFDSQRQSPLTAMEFLLPEIAINTTQTIRGPPFSPLAPSDSRSTSRTSLSKFSSAAIWDSPRFLQSSSSNGSADSEDIESPFIPWLVFLARSPDKFERLLACSVLASLIKAGLGSKDLREASIGLLVVPPLVDMISKNDKTVADVDQVDDTAKRVILEQAPSILGRLMTDSEYLQKAAYECDAVKVLGKLLKHAYHPVPQVHEDRYWTPNPDINMDVESSDPTHRLGSEGQNPLLLHHLKVRESTLKAIAALAGGREDYRKAFLADEIISHIVESLSMFPRKPRTIKERTSDKPKEEQCSTSATAGYGTNPTPVIIAGCHVVRMLSRSVNILRTALVDHGVATPIFKFLKHTDVDVQIAATSAIINLVVEVSPVREYLTELGVMDILCEHAHSANPALRLNSLWALKHFVDAVGPELKKACLRKLEPGWLVQLICDDTEDLALHVARQRDVSVVDMDDDVDMQSSEEPHRWQYGSNGLLLQLDSSQSTRLRQAEDKLASVRESELNPVRRARNHDLAIQEQGLDFIRNLIGRPGTGLASESASETTEMIDYLFSELGQDRLFEILASKLRSKVLHPFSRRAPVAGRETRVLHPQPKIIMAVIYILVHMAASIPRHRQLVIAQTELLKLLAQQASSKDKDVRVALCHLTINLTWQDDGDEAQACAQRAHELRKLGYHTKMETLKHQDGDLDVRERAKTAAWQIQQATY
ncbi:hypothetical protein G7046_g7965 [Stylonectria norvegica]|nr:hypothetical protein G7046_g7965 [Stylonectria norvegica]